MISPAPAPGPAGPPRCARMRRRPQPRGNSVWCRRRKVEFIQELASLFDILKRAGDIQFDMSGGDDMLGGDTLRQATPTGASLREATTNRARMTTRTSSQERVRVYALPAARHASGALQPPSATAFPPAWRSATHRTFSRVAGSPLPAGPAARPPTPRPRDCIAFVALSSRGSSSHSDAYVHQGSSSRARTPRRSPSAPPPGRGYSCSI